MRLRLLDLYCGAGGSAVGYNRAGFDVVGVDNVSQPHYPFDFILADALEYLAAHGAEYDMIHASPPCQFASEATPMSSRLRHVNLIPGTRRGLIATGKPYVIENVENARSWLRDPIMICGTMLGLPIWRHRYFEVCPPLFILMPPCNHRREPITVHVGSGARHTWLPILCTGGGDRRRANRKTHRPREAVDVIRWAMGIDWMTQSELTEAIPPAYTDYLGRHLLARLMANRTA